MNIAVLCWVDSEHDLVMFEVTRTKDSPEEPPLVVITKNDKTEPRNAIRFRMIFPQEAPHQYQGFKLYGIGRFRIVADAGVQEAGTGKCYAFAMDSKEIANVVNRLAYRGNEVRCSSEAVNEAVKRAADPVDADDLMAVTGEMIEELIGGAK